MPLTHLGTDRPGRVPYEISWWQLCMIVVSAHASVVVSYAPMVSSRIPPVRDAWLASLVAWVPGLVLALIAWWLAKRFEGQNVFEFAFSIFGRSLGAVINDDTFDRKASWTEGFGYQSDVKDGGISGPL